MHEPGAQNDRDATRSLPARLGPIELRNRIVKAATFEGRTPKRVVTPELIEFHRRFAAGGVGMTTVAYCAVTRAGSTDGHQIVLDDPDVGAGLRALTDAVHAEGAADRRPDRPRRPGREPDGHEVARAVTVARVQPARHAAHAGGDRERDRHDRRAVRARRGGCCATRASTRSRCTSATAIC